MKLEGYSNYEIYPETGQVWSYKNNRFIGSYDGRGYILCTLTKDDSTQEHWRMHRLIWSSVNGEIPEGLQVNHIDENKENNSIYNLNLMTNSENHNWGTRNIRCGLSNINNKSKSKPIIGISNINTKLFPSLSEAARALCKSTSNISKCCKGEKKTVGGYKWQYVDDYLADWWEQEMERIEF